MAKKTLSTSDFSGLSDLHETLKIAASEARRVVSRGALAAFNHVQVRVPSPPTLCESTHVDRPYHSTFAACHGGKIALYFYGLPAGTIAGSRLICNITVWQRTRANGEQTLYIDCEVRKVDVAPMHSLHIHAVDKQFDPSKAESVHFYTPTGTGGVIEIRKR